MQRGEESGLRWHYWLGLRMDLEASETMAGMRPDKVLMMFACSRVTFAVQSI
jgi:hypothetical protein